MFSHQTRGALAQILGAIPVDTAATLLYKHTGASPDDSYVYVVANLEADAS